MDLFEKCNGSGGNFGMLRQIEDTYFVQPVLEGIPGARMIFQGKEVIMWAINNYLGLAGNIELQKIAAKSAQKYGAFTPMGSRLLTGNTKQHIDLENELASFLEKEASVVFNYGYLGVIGTINSLIGENDQIIIDKLSHASMIDGSIRAMKGNQFRWFEHNDMNSLEDELKKANSNRKGGLLIVTEGLFGMRGDLADLPDICELKEKYNARLFVDDAHGCGVMGDNGKGVGEYFNIQDKIDIYFTTFAKSFASIGGVSAGDKNVVNWIRFNARTNIFAKALPMIYVDTVSYALKMIKEQPELRIKMWDIAKRLQDGLVNLGYDIGDTQSPITPVYVPTANIEQSMEIITRLREDFGIFVSGVIYPVVPKNVILFRMIPTALHTSEDVDITLKAYKAIRDQLKLDLSTKPSQYNK